VERSGVMMRALRFVCAAWILPAGFSLIAFFGFFTNYTTDVFSTAGVTAQYHRSVFQYRILGREMVLALARVFEPVGSGWPVPRALLLFDPAGNAGTYWAYVVVHTVATCTGCSFLLLALRRAGAREAAPAGVPIAPELTVVAVSMAVALAAFVVTPYDGVFFALQMAALLVTLAMAPATGLLPLVVLTALATLTRESAYFIPMFFLAVHHRAVFADARARVAFAAVSAAAAVTYVVIRAAIGWSGSGSVFYAWQWRDNAAWTALTGTAMLLAALVLLLAEGRNYRERIWFAALAAPYVVFVHIFAAPWEWRLWVPVLVPLLALQVIPDRASARRQTDYHV
jgi:hypothetical protein